MQWRNPVLINFAIDFLKKPNGAATEGIYRIPTPKPGNCSKKIHIRARCLALFPYPRILAILGGRVARRSQIRSGEATLTRPFRTRF